MKKMFLLVAFVSLSGCGKGSVHPREGFFDGPYAECVRMCEDVASFYRFCGLDLFQDVKACVEEVWGDYMLSTSVCAAASRCYQWMEARPEYCAYAREHDGKMTEPGWEGVDAPPVTWQNELPDPGTDVVQPSWFREAYEANGGEGPAQCGRDQNNGGG